MLSFYKHSRSAITAVFISVNCNVRPLGGESGQRSKSVMSLLPIKQAHTRRVNCQLFSLSCLPTHFLAITCSLPAWQPTLIIMCKFLAPSVDASLEVALMYQSLAAIYTRWSRTSVYLSTAFPATTTSSSHSSGHRTLHTQMLTLIQQSHSCQDLLPWQCCIKVEEYINP